MKTIRAVVSAVVGTLFMLLAFVLFAGGLGCIWVTEKLAGAKP